MDYFSRLQHISTFVFDMDGVLTDGGLLVTETGEWVRRMNVKDGYALQFAVKQGYQVIVISGSTSKPVTERLSRLGIFDVYTGVSNKKALMLDLLKKFGTPLSHVMYMGDDIPDLDCMEMVGLPCCPRDAVREVLAISAFVSSQPGGHGCVRDIIEQVLRCQQRWYAATHIRST